MGYFCNVDTFPSILTILGYAAISMALYKINNRDPNSEDDQDLNSKLPKTGDKIFHNNDFEEEEDE